MKTIRDKDGSIKTYRPGVAARASKAVKSLPIKTSEGAMVSFQDKKHRKEMLQVPDSGKGKMMYHDSTVMPTKKKKKVQNYV